MPVEICPCCKRKMPSVKAKSPADKKLAQDIARAEAAIAALSRYTEPSSRLWWDVSPQLVAACRDEALRMARAIADPRLLWSIYRRKDSGPSYVPEAN